MNILDKERSQKRRLWIALAEVAPIACEALNGARGGYATVVACALDPDEFRELVAHEATAYDLELLGLEEVELLSARLGRGEISESSMLLAQALSEEGQSRMGTIYSFENDD